MFIPLRSLLISLVPLVLLLSCGSMTRADEIGTVTFSGVSSNCSFDVGPCTVKGPQETWSGTFSVDLDTGLILSDAISGSGPGSGPWIGGTPGTFVNSDCLPGPALPLRFGCSIEWHDAAGWVLQWDPGFHGADLLHSSQSEFFGMGLFQSVATSYSVTTTFTPEPPASYVLYSAMITLFALRSRIRIKATVARELGRSVVHHRSESDGGWRDERIRRRERWQMPRLLRRNADRFSESAPETVLDDSSPTR